MDFPSRAHIIHIPGDSRREKNVVRLKTSLKAVGIDDVQVYEGVRPQDRGPLYSVGEWGCYQSHVGCMRRIAESGDEAPSLVLEDDAVLDAPPVDMARVLASTQDFDVLHLGYLSNTVFRDWDDDLQHRAVQRVRGVLYGTQCYAVQATGLEGLINVLERLPYVAPEDGGGVGIDGALCEASWRDPSLVRMATTASMFRTLPGVRSGLRRTSALQRGKERARAIAGPARRLVRSAA